jgi:hypothetical protein
MCGADSLTEVPANTAPHFSEDQNICIANRFFKKCCILIHKPCDNSSASFAAFISACWILWPDAFARRSPRKYTATVYTLVFVGPLHSITLRTKCNDINCKVHHWCDTKTFKLGVMAWQWLAGLQDFASAVLVSRMLWTPTLVWNTQIYNWCQVLPWPMLCCQCSTYNTHFYMHFCCTCSPLLYIPPYNMSKRPPGKLSDVMHAKRNCMSLSIKDKVV